MLSTILLLCTCMILVSISMLCHSLNHVILISILINHTGGAKHGKSAKLKFDYDHSNSKNHLNNLEYGQVTLYYNNMKR